MNTLRQTLVAVVLSFVVGAGPLYAQGNTNFEFYGHYHSAEEANRVASAINTGNASGWSNAIAEQSPHPITRSFGVYARRVSPQDNLTNNATQPRPPIANGGNRGLATNPDLAVTIRWNTKSDIDLWVTEPNGAKCSFQNRSTTNGGVLHEDNTSGFGPEHYTLQRAGHGVYIVSVNNYRGDAPTTVNVEVTRFAGTPNQTTQTYTVQLQRAGQTVEVCRVQY